MVGQRVLVPSIGVRIPIPEQNIKQHLSESVVLFYITVLENGMRPARLTSGGREFMPRSGSVGVNPYPRANKMKKL